MYNIPERDIGNIRIPSIDGKSNQNIHFKGLSVYSAAQSPLDIIRVYGLSDIVGQTYRQEEGSAYTKLSRESTFQPWLNLDIPRLTDDLSAIGNKVGVSQNTTGVPKLYSVRLGNASDSNTSSFNYNPLIVAGSIIAALGTAYKVSLREDEEDEEDKDMPRYPERQARAAAGEDEDMPRFPEEAEAEAEAEVAEVAEAEVEEVAEQQAAAQAAAQAEQQAGTEAAIAEQEAAGAAAETGEGEAETEAGIAAGEAIEGEEALVLDVI
jgi:hypothetical protein